VPRSGPVAEVVCPPLRPVLRDDDHCVSFRVFASSRETNAVVCPRLRTCVVQRLNGKYRL
ncbi:MAG: hypothetical protein ACK6D4_21350, partial [Planctomyces sp.]